MPSRKSGLGKLPYGIQYTAMDEITLESLGAHVARQHKTTQNLITDSLRIAILRGLLETGQPLKQDTIAAQFGVSKIPIREALKQLEGEGLVTFRPHRSAIVSQLSYKEALEVGEIRIALESLALKLALPNLTQDDLRQAEEIIDLADSDREDAGSFDELNWEFHKILLEPADRPRLVGAIKSLHTAFQRYVRVYASLMDLKPQAQRLHRQILDACKRKDSNATLRALEQDIQMVVDAFPEYLEQKETTSTDVVQRGVVPGNETPEGKIG